MESVEHAPRADLDKEMSKEILSVMDDFFGERIAEMQNLTIDGKLMTAKDQQLIVRYKAADMIYSNFEMEIEHLHFGMKLPDCENTEDLEIEIPINQIDER